MRFWLVIIAIFGMVYYAYAHYFGDDEETIKTEETHDSALQKIKLARSSKPNNNDHPSISPRPVVSKAVRFNSRPVPSDSIIRSLIGSPVQMKTSKNKNVPARTPVRFAVDVESNSVLLIGDMEELYRVVDLLEKLDVVVSTCHLKTWVVWVRGDKQTSFDIVARIVADGQSSALASLGGGVFTAFAQIDKLQLAFEASSNQGSLEIVDQPYMQLVQAVQSEITTGEEIAIPSTTSNQGVTETSIEFKTVGLSLAVTPWFLAHNRVRLAVEQENGVVGNIRKIDGIEIPEVFKQTLKTSVEMQLGQTVVLGGVETAKRVHAKGWLHKKEERRVGHLYVVASIYSTVPKARPITDLKPDFPLRPGSASSAGDEFLDGNDILPTKYRKPEIKTPTNK